MNSKPSLRNLLALCAAAFSLSGIAATAQTFVIQPPKATQARVAPNYGKLPLSFEPNRGQADPSVQFLARGSHYNVLLQPTTATLLLNRDDASAQQPRVHDHAASVTSAAIRMTLDGANPRAAMSPDRELPGYVNYISGDKARTHTGIPTYAAARATGVYPGIDLVYYGTERQLEYDFVVSPQSDPGQIHLSIAGAHPVVEPNGQLRLQLAAKQRDTDIVFRKPVLYQTIDGKQQPVEGSFTVAANGEVGFQVGRYDHARELVIDPVISYATYFGGSGYDSIRGSALNASNQLYAVGETESPTLPAGTGEFEASRNPSKNSNNTDAFVTKISADGSTVLWTTYLSGDQSDSAAAVAVNASDQAYVVGSTNSCLSSGDTGGSSTSIRFPFTVDAIQTLCNPSPQYPGGNFQVLPIEGDGGSYDVFLVKLSSDGKTELYGTPLGGTNNDLGQSVVLDATGRPYIVGQTYSTQYNKCASGSLDCDVPSYPVDNHGKADTGAANYPTTANAFYSNTSESFLYATTDGSGNVTGPADEQAFLTVLSADLHSFVYSSLIGGGILGGCGNGACNTNGYAIAVNAAGQAFIGGNTSSAHWPTTTGAFATTCSNPGAANSTCNLTAWLAGFDPSKSGTASLLFSTYLNGSSAGSGNYPVSDIYGVAVDSKGNVVATGDTNANNFPTNTGSFQPACQQSGGGSCASAFITKLSPAGATVWSTYFGPTTQPGAGASTVANSVALDASDNVYVVGLSNSTVLPLVHPFSTNPSQQSDAFIIELSPTASTELMGTFLGSGGGINVNYNSLHLDSNLNAYFSGSQGYNPYGGTSFPVTSNAPLKNLQGTDGWLVKLITQQQISTTALQITPNAGAPGTSIGFTATVTGLPAFATPTGTVTLTSGQTTLGSITLTNGTGTFSTTSLTAGTYSVIATYSGDVVYATSATTAQAVSIQNAPTIALTATPSTTTVGTAVALKATVSSSAGTPTGTVYFLDGNTTLGSTPLSSGVANYSATALGVGSHSITARYGGDNNFAGLTSTAQTVTINLITPVVSLTATPSTAQVGTAIALATTVTGSGGTPTGTVTFLDGTTTLTTVNLANGVADYSATALSVGMHSITASYSGDGTFSALVSSAQIVNITAVPPSISAAFSPTSLTITHGSTGSSTLTVTPANGFAGTLTFSCGSLPSSASCGFLPASLTFTATSSAPQSTVITVSTNASIIGALQPAPFGPRGWGSTGAVFAALLLLPLAFTRRSRKALRKRSFLTLGVLLLSLEGLGALSGCGGPAAPAAPSATPTGNYTLSISIAGAPTNTTINLPITVQ